MLNFFQKFNFNYNIFILKNTKRSREQDMGSLCLNSSRKSNNSDTSPVPQSKKSRVNNQDKAKLDI